MGPGVHTRWGGVRPRRDPGSGRVLSGRIASVYGDSPAADDPVYLLQELEREQGEAKWLDIIEKDLHRQFPFHEMFAARGGHG